MRMVRLATILGVLLAVALAAPARALTDEEVRHGIAQYFDRYGALLSRESIAVEAAGGKFAVAIVGIRYPVGLNHYLDVEQITYVLEPVEDGLYRVSDFSLPGTLPVRTSEGRRVGRWTLNFERLEGLFAPAIRNFLSLNMSVTDLDLLLPEEEASITIARISSEGNSTRRGDGLWDSEGRFRAARMGITARDGSTVEVAGIDFDMSVRDLNLEAYGDQVRRFEAQIGDGSFKSLLNAASTFWTAGPRMMGGFDGKATFDRVRFVGPSAGETTKLREARFEIRGENHRNGHSDLGFTIGHSGLDLPSAARGPANPYLPLVPLDQTINVTLRNLPHQEIGRAYFKLLSAVMGSGGSQPNEKALLAAGQLMFVQLLGLMNRSGTTIELNDSDFVSRAVQTRLSGTLAFDATAALNVVGALEAEITGYDNLLEIARAAADAEQGDPSVDALERLRSVSRRSEDGRGHVIDGFRVDITREGEIRVNGRPYNQLFGHQN